MAAHRSFTEYVKKRFDNNFWAAAESYLEYSTSPRDGGFTIFLFQEQRFGERM